MVKLEEQGAIQAFEYKYGLAWNVMTDFLEHQGPTDIYGSCDAIRKAFQLGQITDGNKWMGAYQSRAKTSRSYCERRSSQGTPFRALLRAFVALQEKMEFFLDRDQNVAPNRFSDEISLF